MFRTAEPDVPVLDAPVTDDAPSSRPASDRHDDERAGDAEPVLRVHLPERWCLKTWHLLLVAGFGLFFMYNNYLRLFYSDVWGHVTYGEWILDHRELPVEEPVVPLAAGGELVDTAWLGQVTLAAAGRLAGPEGYSALFAATILLTYLVLTATFHRQTERIGLASLAAALVWAVNWGRHAVIRPEMFGGLCFALVIAAVVAADSRRIRRADCPDEPDARAPRWLWLAVPLTFALWANLHGSFVVGLALLGCQAAGRAVEVLWSTRDGWAIVRDRAFRRWVLLTELALAASLVNPYGFDLLIHTALFPSNPNLRDIVEWYSLEMISLEGITVGASWVIMLIVLRHSRARVRPADVLALAVFTLAVCLRVRMVAWYGPVWMLVLAPHLRDVWDRLTKTEAVSRRLGECEVLFRRSPRNTVFAGLIVWLAFAFSPSASLVLGGRLREPETLYHSQTPRGVAAYLREHPPRGTVANPQWWGDWLGWDGPEGIEPMMSTNAVHVAPPRVWKDYMAIANAAPGYTALLEKYRINTIVVHKELQTDLTRSVRRLPGWKIVYEDDLGLIAIRQ